MTWLQGFLWTMLVIGSACTSPKEDPARDTNQTSTDSEPEDPLDSAVEGPLVVSPALTLETGTQPTNVLLLTVDTLRVDRLNSNGYATRTTTPNLDALLSAAVNLKSHHSCASWTYPAFICAYTGYDQLNAGVWPELQPYTGGEALGPFPGYFPSFVADLNNQGFQTAMVTGNQVLRGFGMEAGFDVHVKCPSSDCLVGLEGIAAATTQKAIDLFGTFDRGEPWLLQVHYFEPHLPNYPPLSYREALGPLPDCSLPFQTMEEQIATLDALSDLEDPEDRQNCLEIAEAYYDAEIRFMDDEIGRLMEFLESQGIWEDTLLVYFSDHGEEYFDRGGWGHGTSNFQEQTGASGAFYQPGNLTPFTVTGPTTMEDVAPTLYALLGKASDNAFTGQVINNDPDRLTYQLNFHTETAQHSVTSSFDKLVYFADCSPMEYYNLSTDPLETQNAYDPNEPRVALLWEALRPHIQQLSEADDEYSPCGADTW